MNKAKKLNVRKSRRIGRVRALVSGTAERPRLVVNRSNRYVSAQLIDDAAGRTLLSATSFAGKKAVTGKTAATKEKKTKTEQAFAVGESLAKKAVEKGITKAVFDRRSNKFHGRVKNFADGAKQGGLTI
jgi:large subunit ribosomal protein L18